MPMEILIMVVGGLAVIILSVLLSKGKSGKD
jgi:hypothetical protein